MISRCRVRKQVVNIPSFVVRLDSQKHIDFALSSPYGGGRPGTSCMGIRIETLCSDWERHGKCEIGPLKLFVSSISPNAPSSLMIFTLILKMSHQICYNRGQCSIAKMSFPITALCQNRIKFQTKTGFKLSNQEIK